MGGCVVYIPTPLMPIVISVDTLKKDKIPNCPEQCLNLLTSIKDKWQTSRRPVLHPSQRDESATWTLLIQ